MATRKKPPKKEPRTRLDVDARRAQLVALGIERFGGQSYDEVSIDHIAQAAGISKGLLYHYFPTKRAFFAACVKEAADRLVTVTDLPDDVDPLDRLVRSVDAYLGYVRAHAPAFATLMHGLSADREIAAIIDRTRRTLLGRLTDGLTSFPARSAERVVLPATPRMRVALSGWIGMAEATSLAWIDAIAEDPAAAPSQTEIRDLLTAALVRLVESLSAT